MLRRPLVLLAAAAGWLVPAVVAAGTASAQAPRESSTNWAGYAASGPRFQKVSASWVVTPVRCTPGIPTDSAAWVGLGGFAASSRRIEQLGTEALCTATGRARYSAWYELLPAAAVPMPLAVRPGDRMTGSVTVRGRAVTMRLRNRTRGTVFQRVLHPAAVDVSSAEWVVEAPSICSRSSRCTTSRLADFGSTTFTTATAISTSGRLGGIGDGRWAATPIDLAATRGGSALTGALSPSGTSFSVAYVPAAT